ncbi:MAG: FlgD immunoglobulin-like domain containing protein [Candidatus Eisenbacteria bacterium]
MIEYYLVAVDGAGLESRSPANAPEGVYSFVVTDLVHAWDAEPPVDMPWELGWPDDDATAGFWILADPVGTDEDGRRLQAEDDHTDVPGTHAWITGNGDPGGWLGDADVDHGCTSLVSPSFDLAQASEAYLVHHLWYAEGNFFPDDVLAIEVSDDDGVTWRVAVEIEDSAAQWELRTLAIHDYVALSSQVRVRFRACDLGIQGIVEAGLDDVQLEVVPSDLATSDAVPTALGGIPQLLVYPVPSSGTVRIELRLAHPMPTTLTIVDAGGRVVRTLQNGAISSGVSRFDWDARDAEGNQMTAGVYFARLRAEGRSWTERMVLLR